MRTSKRPVCRRHGVVPGVRELGKGAGQRGLRAGEDAPDGGDDAAGDDHEHAGC